MTTSSIEKNKLNNIDLMQIEYLSDVKISKKDIIVIEQNNPIASTIRRFLVGMGFENIYICKDTNEGMKIFSDFLSNEISVPIIIDDNISSKNLKNFVMDILEIQLSAKIAVITAKEQTDPKITELFDIGVSSIIRKPLNVTELKNSIFIMLEEKGVGESMPMEEKGVGESMSIEERFKMLLSCNIISENRTKTILHVNQSEMESIIQNAKKNQSIVSDREILEATCNQCKSPNIVYSSKCPSCKQTNIKQETLVEHYSCGEVYPKEIGSNICPKCNKHIGSVGKDYLESTDYYVCKSCDDKFPRPFFELICLECGNVFIEGTILWQKDVLYRVTN